MRLAQQPKALRSAALVLELATPFEPVTWRQLDLRSYFSLCIFHKSNQIASVDKSLHQRKARRVLPVDLDGARLAPDFCDVADAY